MLLIALRVMTVDTLGLPGGRVGLGTLEGGPGFPWSDSYMSHVVTSNHLAK